MVSEPDIRRCASKDVGPLKRGELWDPALVGERNEAFLKKVWKPLPSWRRYVMDYSGLYSRSSLVRLRVLCVILVAGAKQSSMPQVRFPVCWYNIDVFSLLRIVCWVGVGVWELCLVFVKLPISIVLHLIFECWNRNYTLFDDLSIYFYFYYGWFPNVLSSTSDYIGWWLN